MPLTFDVERCSAAQTALLAAFEKNDVVRKAEEDRLLTVFKWMDRDKVKTRGVLAPAHYLRAARLA
jgi:hypothetical protein